KPGIYPANFRRWSCGNRGTSGRGNWNSGNVSEVHQESRSGGGLPWRAIHVQGRIRSTRDLQFLRKTSRKRKRTPQTTPPPQTPHAPRAGGIKTEIPPIPLPRTDYPVSTYDFHPLKDRLLSVDHSPNDNANRPPSSRTTGRRRPPNSAPAPTDPQTDPTVQSP